MVATAAFTGGLEVPDPVVVALCTTAVAQLLLPIPLIVSMASGKASEAPAALTRFRVAVVPTVVLAMVALGTFTQVTGIRLMRF